MRRSISFFLVLLVCAFPAFADSNRSKFDSRLDHILAALTREAAAGRESESTLSDLLQSEFGTRETELAWALERSLPWSEIVVFAYIQATNGRPFVELREERAYQDLYEYTEKSGMSHEKIVRSLETFLKRAERARNTRIFERLRVSRRVHPLPDLSSGFGLFQEALDFRRMDLPRPTKIHTDSFGRGKGEK